MPPRFAPHLWIAAAISTLACSASPDDPSSVDTGGSSMSSMSEAADDSDAPEPPQFVPLQPREVCDRLLQCADLQSPSQYGDFFPQFGATGSCWSEFSDVECEQACVEALGVLGCGFCNSSTVCPCDPKAYTCVDCLVDTHCDEYAPHCLSRGPLCVQCLVDDHCHFPECTDQAGTCENNGCSVTYSNTFDFTVEATGLGAWEGARVLLRVTNEPSRCGPGFYQIPEILRGQFEVLVYGQTAQGLALRMLIDSDADGIEDDTEPTATIELGGGQPDSIVVTAADFQG